MKKRHIAIFFVFAFLLTLLCACGKQAQQPENSGEEPTRSTVMKETENPLLEKKEETTVSDKGEEGENSTIPANSTPIDGEQAQDAMALLRERMENEPQIALAAACLGYREEDDTMPLTDWLWVNSRGLMEEMPFIQTIPENCILGAGYGVLYCLVPRDDNTTLAVNHVTWESTGNGVWPEVDEVLYRDEYAQPVLVSVGYDFMDENDKRWPDIQICAVAGNGAEVVWYPDCYPESFIINVPIDEDYNPLILNLDNLTAIAPDNREDGDDNWVAPDESLLSVYFHDRNAAQGRESPA